MSTTPQSLFTRLAQQRLARGQAALRAGRREEATLAFRQAVAADPYHVDSLLWLAGMCEDAHESMRHLTRVLALDPRNDSAHEGIRWARKRLGADPLSSRPVAVPAFVRAPAALRESGPFGGPQRPDPVPAGLRPPVAGAAVREAGGPVPAAPLAPPAPAEATLSPLAPVSCPAGSSTCPAVGAGVHASGGRSRPPRILARRFGARLFAMGFGLWLVLIAVLSGVIVWILMHPPTAITAAPVVAQAAAPEPRPSAAVTPSAANPENQPVDQASLDALHAAATLRELDSALAVSDWERAVALAAQALAFRPQDQGLRRKLMSAYFNRAVALMDNGDLDNALRAYNQALDVIPGDPDVQLERDTLVNYMTGLNSFNQRNWLAAIQMLTRVYSSDAGYLDARELLYRANYNRGSELKQKKDLAGALKAFQAAVNLDNEAIEARGELAQVKAALAPPALTPPAGSTRPGALPGVTPAAPGATGAKWIDVNLTTQRFRALRGDTVVYSYITSTGEKARPTTAGRYEVLDKIPNAYSRFWNLWMPYWMGIYWAGSSENGIHALPILRGGQTLWSGFLGRRVSFGCVILDSNAAKIVYDWADIGTPVIIHY